MRAEFSLNRGSSITDVKGTDRDTQMNANLSENDNKEQFSLFFQERESPHLHVVNGQQKRKKKASWSPLLFAGNVLIMAKKLSIMFKFLYITYLKQ